MNKIDFIDLRKEKIVARAIEGTVTIDEYVELDVTVTDTTQTIKFYLLKRLLSTHGCESIIGMPIIRNMKIDYIHNVFNKNDHNSITSEQITTPTRHPQLECDGLTKDKLEELDHQIRSDSKKERENDLAKQLMDKFKEILSNISLECHQKENLQFSLVNMNRKDYKLLIIKCGGAYLTKKDQHQQLNQDNFNSLLDILDSLLKKNYKLILIIGAGSFGHHEAKQYKITGGFNYNFDEVNDVVDSRKGMIATRFSVLKLLNLVCLECQKRSISAMPCSPFDGWMTDNNVVIKHNADSIQSMLDLSIIPVLHGDVCLDRSKGCTILSGDTIIQVLCEQLKPQPTRAIFITDVSGVYDRPPNEPNAIIISNISSSSLTNNDISVSNSKSEHDVTGGMRAKLQSALNIANMNIDVVIIGGDSKSILESPNLLNNDHSSVGTVITNK
ncbi:amino acid kinase [Heterostelium album PN500]|uniref:Isopentenyl phosphate kinase n=1 Tax=Heterostelium pallidum (strain ATCC 26659 / Pp 5 / PN500) TaxID=670386 RepID=D3BU45_HETP5|nr:amino acid kinase [Heterostelium album PN500]EFA75231.1 amino acid kinase [Heterostelium album PN500]|eukprot:XP_020427365.1 amino acid kinase [Heterostelium album PN500]